MSKDVKELVRRLQVASADVFMAHPISNEQKIVDYSAIRDAITLLSTIETERDDLKWAAERVQFYIKDRWGVPTDQHPWERSSYERAGVILASIKSQPAQPQEEIKGAVGKEIDGWGDEPTPPAPAETPEKAWVEWWVSWVRKEGRDPDMFDLCKEFDRRLSNGGQK